MKARLTKAQKQEALNKSQFEQGIVWDLSINTNKELVSWANLWVEAFENPYYSIEHEEYKYDSIMTVASIVAALQTRNLSVPCELEKLIALFK